MSLMIMILLVVMLVPGCGGPEIAETGDIVKVHYTGRLQDGTVFDTSVGSNPLEFTLGQGQLISGFEHAVIGMQAGESKTVTIPVDEAYGPRYDDLILEVERNELPENLDPKVGMQLQMIQLDGGIMIVTITDVSETTIKVDANHPLAGHDLIFDIELIEIETSQSGQTTSQDLISLPLEQALDNGLPTLAEFGSSTCVPCKQMKPILEKLAVEYEGKLNVVIVEVYEQMELTQRYEILAIPTQIVFDSSDQEVTRHIGLWPREEIIAQLTTMGVE
ncbi:MAG: FKBP-type peptidyl-prolyl cis-trans isomerase [Dehalococcoidales bacterium]|nr:FKBP-type peptidyl-prolyl cis-trans isomerase [Dehalococcoidales bacterium]